MAAKSTSSTRAKQFPAKEGAPAVEVDKRSAGNSDGTRYIRHFVVLGGSWSTPGPGVDQAHEANRSVVANEAIQIGLHPRGDVSFDGAEDHPDGLSTILTYSVETVPASIDHAPQDTTTPGDILKGEV